MKQFTIMACILAMVAGCNETQQVETVAVPDIKPLIQHLIPIHEKHQNWKDAYGDGWESLVAYNFIILRDNDLVIARTIEGFHPKSDPNVPTLESRVEWLERKTREVERISKDLMSKKERKEHLEFMKAHTLDMERVPPVWRPKGVFVTPNTQTDCNTGYPGEPDAPNE